MWSVGCILYEALTGAKLFNATNDVELLTEQQDLLGTFPQEYGYEAGEGEEPRPRPFIDKVMRDMRDRGCPENEKEREAYYGLIPVIKRMVNYYPSDLYSLLHRVKALRNNVS